MNPIHSRIAIIAMTALATGAIAQEATAPPRDPARTAADVEQALEQAEGVPAKDISVGTHANTILLTGEVGSEVEGARALSAAEKAAGSARVSSRLEVRPENEAEQQQAAQRVRSIEEALRRDVRTVNLGIAVAVNDADAIELHGLVPNAESRTAAENVASKANGDKPVINKLEVPAE